MKKISIIIFLLCFSFIIKAKDVLILNSYHYKYSWTNMVYSAIYDKLITIEDLNIYTENLDAKIFRDTSYYNIFTNYLLQKYSNIEFDVIVTTDNAAIDYIIMHQYIPKFQQAYKVYAGVSDSENYILLGNKYFGVHEGYLIRERLDLICNLLPNLEQIYFVVNKGNLINDIEKIVRSYRSKYKIDILVDSEPRDLINLVENPPTLNAIMFIYGSTYNKYSMFVDKDMLVNKLSEVSKIPISPTSYSKIGKSNIGGIFLSEKDHGNTTANIVIQILENRNIYSIPKVSISLSEIIFDYNSLKKFNINISDVPSNALIMNTPQNIFNQYKNEVMIAIIFFGILIVVIIFLIYNIVRRRNSELSLIKSNKRFQDIVQMLPQTVFECDPKGNLLFVNKKGLELFGVSESVFNKGINIFELFETAEHSLIHESLQKLLINGISEGNIFTAIKQDGTKFPLQMHTVVLYEKNKPEVIRGIAIDVTKIKEIEQNLIEAHQKADESNKMKSAFLSNLSHEIRTPLNAIVGFSSLLTDGDKTPEELEEFNRLIQNSSNYLLTLINDIIDYSKIEAGQLDLVMADVNINKLFDELLLQYEKEKIQNNKRHLHLINDTISENTIYIANTDRVRLKQILSNLIDNSLKFTDEGTISFGFRLEKDDTLLFYVKDTGLGINPDDIKSIFKRFYKISQSSTKYYRGSGLGLSISQNLVSLLGGNIWAESEKGVGSIFRFTIKCKIACVNKDADKKILTNIDHYNFSGKSILIAEDELSNFEFLRIILNKTGAEIVRAVNGQEAINMVNTRDFDLVIMDIQMPVMNGYEAIKRIKSFKPRIAIIAQTAYAMTGDKEKILSSGCEDYIAKPINKNNLLKLVGKYLN